MRKLSCAVVLALVVSATVAIGQTESFTLAVTPSFTLPLGTSATAFNLGAAGELAAAYRMPFLPLLYAGGNAGYSFVPIKTFTTLSMVNAGASVGLHIDILPMLSLRTGGSVGYYFAFLNNGAGPKGGNPYFTAGAELALALGSAWRVGVGTTYRYFAGLYNDLAISLGTSYNLLAPKTTGRPLFIKGIEIQDLTFDDVFPVLHTWYESHSFGMVRIKNAAKVPISNVSVSLNVKQYMDAATECAKIPEMKPGEERTIAMKALFGDEIFNTVQMTKAAAEVSVAYTIDGVTDARNETKTLTVWDRNSMTWDITAKAAAFVMPKEPAVITLSNNVSSAIKDNLNRAIDKNLQNAMAVHDALRLMGISYASPPLTSYAVRSLDKSVVDSLKFPRQTIEGHAGDCSDLSILYSSLLESLQIETAFITIPGHIFMAFAMRSTPDDAKRLSAAGDLIVIGDKVWVPIEVTERDETFLAAWQLGAKEWRENLAAGQAELLPVHEAWKTFVPANFTDSGVAGSAVAPPEPAKVVKDFTGDLDTFVNREIFAREAELVAEVTKTKNDPKAVNELGLLYARYDQSAKAEVQFNRIIAKTEYMPALVNLGNLYFAKEDYKKALTFYQRAFKQAPHNPVVLLSLARANYELGNYDDVKKAYDEVKALNLGLAVRFSYLELKGTAAVRAAAAGQATEEMVWAQE